MAGLAFEWLLRHTRRDAAASGRMACGTFGCGTHVVRTRGDGPRARSRLRGRDLRALEPYASGSVSVVLCTALDPKSGHRRRGLQIYGFIGRPPQPQPRRLRYDWKPASRPPLGDRTEELRAADAV
eukprot:7390404-Prymnesium_polylepis.2